VPEKGGKKGRIKKRGPLVTQKGGQFAPAVLRGEEKEGARGIFFQSRKREGKNCASTLHGREKRGKTSNSGVGEKKGKGETPRLWEKRKKRRREESCSCLVRKGKVLIISWGGEKRKKKGGRIG